MKCPRCNSHRIESLKLIHEAGESRSRNTSVMGGIMMGLSGSLMTPSVGSLVGMSYGMGKSRSLLAKRAKPPFAFPLIRMGLVLAVIAFFIYDIHGLNGAYHWLMKDGDPQEMAKMYSSFVLLALAYNIGIARKRRKAWLSQYMCRQCGHIHMQVISSE